jgi:hypothetical protein
MPFLEKNLRTNLYASISIGHGVIENKKKLTLKGLGLTASDEVKF